MAAHREQALQEFYAAFARLIVERGYDAVTLADVAVAAGTSRTTIYNYFSTKDALAVGFAEHEVQSYVAELQAAVAAVDDPIEKLRVYIRHQVVYVATHHLSPGRGLQMILPMSAYQRVVHHVQVLEGMLQDILHEGVAAGAFADDIEASLPLVVACINRGGPVAYQGVDLDDEVELTETFVLRALGAREPKRRSSSTTRSRRR